MIPDLELPSRRLIPRNDLNFILMKKLSCLLLAVVLGLSAAADPVPADVIAYGRLPALAKLSQDYVAFVQSLKLPPDLQMQATLPLMMMGYPTFPGVSPEEPVRFFLRESESAPTGFGFLLIAEIGADSPMRESLAQFGFTFSERGERVLIAQDSAMFEGVADLDEWFELTDNLRGYKIELQVAVRESLLVQAREALDVETGPLAGLGRTPDSGLWKGFILTALDSLSNCKGFGIGLDLSEQGIRAGMLLEARPETPEAAFVSAGHGGKVGEAAVLSGSGAIGMTYRLDPQATAALVDSFASRLEAHLSDQMADHASSYLRLSADWVRNGNGSFAMVMNPVGEEVRFSSRMAGNYSKAALDQFFQHAFNESLAQAIRAIGGEQGLEMVFETNYDPSAGSIEGVSYAKYDVKSGAKLEDESREQELSYFYAIQDGDFLNASSEAELATLVSGDFEGPSLAKVMGDGTQAVRWFIDVARYMKGFAEAPEADELTNSIREAAGKLEAAGVEPFQIATDFEGNWIDSTLILDSENLARMIPLFQPSQH